MTFERSPVRAGRSRDNDLLLPDGPEPRSSGRHAEFTFEDGAWWVTDRGSLNGTRVNGAPVARARLRHGDRVTLGDVDLEVRVGGRRPGALALAAGVLLALAAIGWYAWQVRGPIDRIAASARASACLIVIHDGDRFTPVGTAFAIGEYRLATNAHVAAPLTVLLEAGDRRPILALTPDASVAPRRVTGVTPHPGWTPASIADDVAVLEVAPGRPLTPLRLAGDRDVSALAPGDPIAVFGFPSPFSSPWSQQGTLVVSTLREVRGARYLVAEVSVAPGSSGSPVFTLDGQVVGMMAGSAAEPGAPGGRPEHEPGVAISAVVIRELASLIPSPPSTNR